MKRDKLYAHLLAFWAYLMSEGYSVNTGRISGQPVSIIDMDALIEGYISALDEMERNGHERTTI